MQSRIRVSNSWAASLGLAAAAALLIATLSTGSAQAPGMGGGQRQGPPPPPPPTAGAHLDIVDGSSASYKVTEQFVGIDFPNDAIGTSTAVSGSITIAKDGSISPDSRLTVDLTKLASDQDMRDNFSKNRTLDVKTYPDAVFVPTKVEGLPAMIPYTGQSGVKLTGDMTIHGVTKPVTFQGYVTFNRDGSLEGRAKTTFNWTTFGLTKPAIARLMSVGDDIELDIVFKFKRS